MVAGVQRRRGGGSRTVAGARLPPQLPGEYVALELAASQTIENLEAFGRRLAAIHDRYLAGTAGCECEGRSDDKHIDHRGAAARAVDPG